MPPIYHITHISNLNSIIATGGLHCDNGCASGGIAPTGIAHAHIKQRRAQRVVPVPPGGTLADYVPFYFAPRSPMLYSIHTGYVAGYQGGQTAVLHLVSSAQSVASNGHQFAFSDGHAEISFSAFSNQLGALQQLVDWAVMPLQYWNDTPADPDRKRRRQAEFLVHQFFPWTLVDSIGVYDQATATQVQQVLQGAAHKPVVNICAGWYY